MDFHVSLDSRGDYSARVYRALLDAILDGRVRPGERLPPTRVLARSLGVSRNTVAAAYDRLSAEGFVDGRVGDGTFVTEAARSTPARRRRGSGPGGPGGLRPRSGWTVTPQPVSSAAPPPLFDFRVGIPDGRLFPFDTWRRLVAGELRLSAGQPAAYGDPAGHPGLRAEIARYVGVGRSVRADADDVVVTSGAQQAIDLIGRVLLTPGDVVAVEEPGYPPARDLFSSLGAHVVGVPVDEQGLVVDALPARARLVYTTPSHQFPLGTPMSLVRRRALLAWADRRDAAIVEDDYDSEFRFSDRPLEPLQSLDTGGRVLYVGTFSKTLLPSLRVGFVVTPPSLRAALRAAKQLSDIEGPVATQAALARFMGDGLLARHVRKAARTYGERHAQILDFLESKLSGQLDVVPSSAGLHLCARLRSGDVTHADSVLAAAHDRSVAVDSLARYCADQPQAGFVFGYGALRDDTVNEGLTRFRLLLTRSSRRLAVSR
jgi:GntR family transcriptional regulator/MocR family aminotransferase